ncbi:MAG: hypothetical protein WCK00_16625 [Deltaproteobacteria bacterium]
MNKIISRMKIEILAVIPTTLFFFISFQLLALTKALILQEHGIRISTFASATIAALVVAKIVLIADLLPFIN